MKEMLANRYLLNGEPHKAARLYGEALQRQPGRTSLRCRLILAYLWDSKERQAVQEMLILLKRQGKDALQLLQNGCEGYLPLQQKPAGGELTTSLWRLMRGETKLALDRLQLVKENDIPEMTELLKFLDMMPKRQTPSLFDDAAGETARN